MPALLGRKIGMTQTFGKDGACVPVTVIQAGPCHVVQVKTVEGEGYSAIQIGFEDLKPGKATLPAAGHCQKAEVAPQRFLREVRVPPEGLESYKAGQELRVEVFRAGDVVDVVGTTKGRGTAGVMKKWGMKCGHIGHGTHERHRHAGATGIGIDHTNRGHRMPGRYGADRVTVKNLRVVDVMPDKNVLLVRGAVPGHPQALVLVRTAKTARKPRVAAAPAKEKKGGEK
jgi:large subunit ribosomal protein L3